MELSQVKQVASGERAERGLCLQCGLGMGPPAHGSWASTLVPQLWSFSSSGAAWCRGNAGQRSMVQEASIGELM